MAKTAQKRALENYRRRLDERGMARFEVLGLDHDRALIRAIARRLAANDAGAARIRASVGRLLEGRAPAKGGILAALRRSPLVGSDLDLKRSRETGRRVGM